jgi:hypothetical protein
MSALAKALQLPPARLALAAEAVVLVWAFRAALAVFPFARVRAVAPMLARLGRRSGGSRSLEDFAWATAVAGRRVSGATCLARALGAQALLALHGHPSIVHIGVARSDDGAFEAHAWVEAGTTTIVGGVEASRFTPLAAAPRARR